MKRYLLPSALILALGLGFAWAQSITRSVQLSQDPTGPIGYDYSAKNVYFPGHILFNSNSTPAVSACSTGSVVGTDAVGRITPGSAVTTCTLTFTTAYNSNPACVVAPQGSATFPTYTTTATGITISVLATATTYSYICASVG